MVISLALDQADATAVLADATGHRAARRPAAIPFAAKRSPAAAGTVHDLVTEALVGVLNFGDESDHEGQA